MVLNKMLFKAQTTVIKKIKKDVKIKSIGIGSSKVLSISSSISVSIYLSTNVGSV